MKNVVLVLALAGGLGACNPGSSSASSSADSMQLPTDTLGETVDTTAARAWDSTKTKATDLKQRIEERLEKGAANDSASQSGKK